MQTKLFLSIITAIVVVWPSSGTAQEANPCGAPNFSGNPALEQFAQEFVTNQRAEKTSTGDYVIPVVWHIIHNNGSEKISTTTVNNAMDMLNDDFAFSSANYSATAGVFRNKAADCQIEFRLATIDPDGNATNAINYVQSTETNAGNDGTKHLSRWPRNMYLNIWVVKTIESGAAGYAYFPGDANVSNDGVMIKATSVLKSTLAHEAGHYLNLLHIWGGNNNAGASSNCDIDDVVDDTPNTKGNSFTCNINQTNCGTQDNVNNFMDYTTDACRTMFTKGQRDRMHATLNHYTAQRNQLWKPANLFATGTNCPGASPCAPIAGFSYSSTTVCLNGTVTFRDSTCDGKPAHWQWSFPGGNPSFSTDSIVTVQYDTAGTYSATLTVWNSVDTSTITMNKIIEVSSGTAKYDSTFYLQDVEDSTLLYEDWTFNSTVPGQAWERTDQVAYGGTHALLFDNFNNTNEDEYYELISPSINIKALGVQPMLSFYAAYAKRTSNSSDKIGVHYSINCGKSWSYVKNLSASTIESGLSSNKNPFFPASSDDWKQHVIDLAGIKDYENVQLKIFFRSAWESARIGNNVFMDDIQLYDGLSTTRPRLGHASMDYKVLSNQEGKPTQLLLNLKEAVNCSIKIYDLLGRDIATLQEGQLYEGMHQVALPLSLHGFYLIQIITADEKKSIKVRY